MKVEGTDNTGVPWYVESEGDVDIRVEKCPACGNPIAIINTSEHQAVEKVRFIRGNAPAKAIKIGEFDVAVIEEHLKNFHEPCPWCGWRQK